MQPRRFRAHHGPSALLGQVPGCVSVWSLISLSATCFYACPAPSLSDHNKVSRCGGPEDYFCKAWGCEQTGTCHWLSQNPAGLIKIQQDSTGSACSDTKGMNSHLLCNSVTISFMEVGKQYKLGNRTPMGTPALSTQAQLWSPIHDQAT